MFMFIFQLADAPQTSLGQQTKTSVDEEQALRNRLDNLRRE